MAADRRKGEIVTFKADGSFLESLRGLANRSEFIRAAVLAALDSACPVCKGTGILTPNQKKHWETFARTHSVRECQDCHEFHVLCQHEAGKSPGGAARASGTARSPGRLPARHGRERRR